MRPSALMASNLTTTSVKPAAVMSLKHQSFRYAVVTSFFWTNEID
jgi:hypothetical protein